MGQATIIDGVDVSSRLRDDISRRTADLRDRGLVPGLAVILVGDDPASAVYVRNKVKACESHGLRSTLDRLSGGTTEAELLQRIEELNADPDVHGILVQLPLPKHIDSHKVIEAISAEKDVDGFHVANAGALMTGRARFKPCTPYGVMQLLDAYGIPVAGKHAVIIGRSNIVGKPMSMLLLEAGATVTICHSKTPDLKLHTKMADIIVAAVGKRNIVTGSMIKPGAAVIDVGMNKNDEGKLCGDIDFPSIRETAGFVTPVPGGVGPMTITMLLVNTLQSAERDNRCRLG
jgi:methylenetetrahydrofolate dehydrogenase (NADP+)/methenyltetrahydrofolate cyclohydrolase